MTDSKAWESWATKTKEKYDIARPAVFNDEPETLPKLEVTGKTFPKVDPETVRKAIGAEKALNRKEQVFDSDKAKAFLLRLAADFTEDGVFREEALELTAAAMTSAQMDSDHFYWILERLLEWDMPSITDAMNKVSD